METDEEIIAIIVKCCRNPNVWASRVQSTFMDRIRPKLAKWLDQRSEDKATILNCINKLNATNFSK